MDEDRRALTDLLAPVIGEIAAVPWNAALAERLNAMFPPDGPLFSALEARCDDGITTGWMGLQGDEVRKGARVIEPGAATGGLSVDVVQLIDFCGPHHRHPNGEVCAVMPADAAGQFDGNPRGWAVYPPGSDHWPAVTGGRVRILFLLPDGAIEYTDQDASLRSGATGGAEA
ncbi:DUF4863 family protein [uncultured Rhodospira sp.]|uniref:4-hydroxylaminobenzoate lyase n=1 Tax=uncultured Rhodospira sp. TaxID=1936189 RepID=UPI00261F7698|nr:DUF4863 family protein [uncultured Rhodospira sp.]